MLQIVHLRNRLGDAPKKNVGAQGSVSTWSFCICVGLTFSQKWNNWKLLFVFLNQHKAQRLHKTTTLELEALGLSDFQSTLEHPPCMKKPLTKTSREESPVQEAFGYSSVVGMLLYVAGHTHPDYVINSAARLTFWPNVWSWHHHRILTLMSILMQTLQVCMILRTVLTWFVFAVRWV